MQNYSYVQLIQNIPRCQIANFKAFHKIKLSVNKFIVEFKFISKFCV